MIKYKLFYLIFFLIAIQVAFAAYNSYIAEISQESYIEFENQSHFEENNFSFAIFGKFAKGHSQIWTFSLAGKCLFFNSRLKNLSVSMLPSVGRNNSFLAGSVSLGQDGNRGINESIYLQKGNLKL